MKAIGLVRVSSKAQSIDSQSVKVKQAILADGFDESDIYLIEDIESGSKLSEEERSGLNKLKHYIETEEISVVYAYEISRISRKVSIVYSIRDYLITHKVDLVILNPYFRLLNPDGSMSTTASVTFGIFASLAEQETYLRVERITRGKERKKSEGKLSQGYPIFGYTVDDDHYIIPHPKEAPIVREIFQRYSNLESSGSIGKDLWLRGQLCCKTDKLVCHQSRVCAIVRERRYAYIDEPYRTPLISKELFEKCQTIRSEKPERFLRKSRTKGCYPLQGYVYTEDNYVLTPSITNNRYVKMDGSSQKPLSLNMKAADELTRQILHKYLNSGIIITNLEQERTELLKRQDEDKIKLAGIDSKIDVLKEERSRINRLYVKGRISEEESDKMMKKNNDEIMELEDLKQDLLYNLSSISNKLILAANQLLQEDVDVQLETAEELKAAVQKYLKKISAIKIGFSRYRMTYYFLDGSIRTGTYFSTNKKMEINVEE